MKFSWTSLKISIAGAKLSHLVQKDKIWDHGSMAEQARIIFYLVHKAIKNSNIEALKKQCTISCFEKLKAEADENKMTDAINTSPIINELAIVDVQPGKNNRPDMFSALIKGHLKKALIEKEFMVNWSFIRQGEWWVLDNMKSM
jgi:hypothetical protein